MKIREIMTPEVITVNINSSVADIAEILFKNRFHGIPVTDKGKLAGIITESDFFLKDNINTYLPAYVQFMRENQISGKLPEDTQKKIDKLVNVKAKDIMTTDCLVATPDMEATDLMEIIKKTTFTTFPVADKDKNLLGIVTLSDILGTVKKGSRAMRTVLDAGGNIRRVDKMARDLGQFWNDNFVFLSKKRVATWKGAVLIISGILLLGGTALFAIISSRSNCEIDNKTDDIIECRRFTYSEWSECQQDGTQTRVITSSLPKGCIGGSPELIRSCQK